MKAVIPAAGLGVRFLPATKAQPKEMLPVVDKPCIQYVVEEAVAAGMTDIIIITGRGKRAIEDHFDRSIELEERLKEHGEKNHAEEIRKIAELADIFYIRQKEPLGLGHAILCAKKHIGNEAFAVLLGDDLIVDKTAAIAQLLPIFKEKGSKSIIGLERVPQEQTHKYGIISGKEVGKGLFKIDSIIEKPEKGTEPSNIAVIGRYIFTPEIFDYLEKTKKGYGGEIQLTDAIQLMAKDDIVYGKLIEGRRYDLGDKISWLRANVEIAMERSDLAPQVREWIKTLSAR